jgi:predicted CoA-binding protein
VPVPVYYPDVVEILGRRVYRSLREVPPPTIDMVNVFRRPRDIPPHVGDILAVKPRVVWLQLGIAHQEAAETLARAGIRVVQDRCLLVEHRRLE